MSYFLNSFFFFLRGCTSFLFARENETTSRGVSLVPSNCLQTQCPLPLLPPLAVLLVAHHAKAARAIRGVCKVWRDFLAASFASLKDRPELTSITSGSGGLDRAVSHMLGHSIATAADWAQSHARTGTLT